MARNPLKSAKVLVFMIVALKASISLADTYADVKKTFDRAYINVPDENAAGRQGCRGRMSDPNSLICLTNAMPVHPVVIFLHGCDGMNADALKLMNKLKVLYIAPDSFARPNRTADCKPMTDKKAILTMRFAEAKYAIQQLKKMSNFVTVKFVLMGFSEGASSTTLYADNDFDARIALGWSCQSLDPWWKGIRGSPNTPVLVIAGTDDIYHKNPSNAGDCNAFTSTRPLSQTVLIQNAPHNILPMETTEFKISEFIDILATCICRNPSERSNIMDCRR